MHDIHLNVEKAMMSVENIIKISHDNGINSSCFDKQKIVVTNAYSLAVSDLDECIRFKRIKFLENDFHSVESITKQVGLKFVDIMNECKEFYVADYDICVKNHGQQLKKYIKDIKNELNTVDTNPLMTNLEASIYDCWQSPYQSLNSTLSHVSQQLREYANSPAICEY
ncbi:hypothetical protein HCN44_009404 [Aphidius gifuensis]|uniref:Uncharacterized protein n=1 Tax=Aphidius gifuensis TaxID=684658 RepID=A0A834Y3Q6_APHGI|nr:hypothetical protein HCN44_009404 [Aphidius gifuensis]